MRGKTHVAQKPDLLHATPNVHSNRINSLTPPRFAPSAGSSGFCAEIIGPAGPAKVTSQPLSRVTSGSGPCCVLLLWGVYAADSAPGDCILKRHPVAEGHAFELFPLLVKQRAGGFAIEYSGYLSVATGCRCTLALTSGDVTCLIRQGNLVTDNDVACSPSKKRGSVQLAPGRQPIKILYFAVAGASEGSLGIELQDPSGEWPTATGEVFLRSH